ncbi:hypothetical protein VOLCADRAFT_103050 [Volvox carteri f. nagariensis]|uniref:RNA helicase n=1 Tax=Volvox carteri f. nagariensis TaxID=3068 RepID=D8TJK8_VOLCA|nr:uncharacterized protein VOLCADRAFT_103050 [Volvox carteri f. nagariensis]EFJ52560.1 hypothetical protein VOLCADRAFT_103050 [Volvox carteri f. nagariensis]|eukprot:XP_002946633.1 hypothetical protein VOLCADRAFT_103050 [Volvox carteri f. nagariensis]
MGASFWLLLLACLAACASLAIAQDPMCADRTMKGTCGLSSHVFVHWGEDGTSASSSEGGSTPACCGSDDSECLSGGDKEGVIPHVPVTLPAPPWTRPLPRADYLHHLSQQQHSGALLDPNQIATAVAVAAQPSHKTLLYPFSCTGVRLPLPQPCQPLSLHGGIRMYGKHAATYAETDEAAAAAPDVPAGGVSLSSRPRHTAPLPHLGVAAGPGAVKAGELLTAEEYRQRHGVVVEDPEHPGSVANIPEPFQAFRDAPFPPAVMDVLHSARYGEPSPIQAQAWPIALAGRDLVAIASTGSGKTLGFLLPALLHIQASEAATGDGWEARGCDPALGPTAVVLAPTRELARQIEAEARRFSHVVVSSGPQQQQQRPPPSSGRFGRQHRWGHRGEVEGGLRSACVYGGAARGGQLEELRRLPHLLIATPGRLLDFIEAGDIRMKQVSYLVLDEADRMLDMGFEEQIAEVSRYMSADRQTLFFSATWPSDVRQAAAAFTKRRAVRLFIGDVQSKPVAAATITQRVQVVDGADKLDALEAYLREQFAKGDEQSDGEESEAGGGGQGRGGEGRRVRRAIVFCETKAGCDHLTHNINNTMPFQAASLHGDKSQAARDYALAKFKAGRVPVLVATDVAARGLDIPHVTCVVNYDMPQDIEMYVHRIGRTGRAGAKGNSLALVNRSRDGGVARSLLEVLEGAGQEVPAELRRMADRSRAQGGYTGQRRGGSWSRQGGRGGGWGGAGGGFGGRGRREGGSKFREGGREYRDREKESRDGDWDEEESHGSRRHHADGWRSAGARPSRSSGEFSRW